MGKRKSKTSKQRQARASASASSKSKSKTTAFGVEVRKGTGGRNGGTTTTAPAATTATAQTTSVHPGRKGGKATDKRGFGGRTFAAGDLPGAAGRKGKGKNDANNDPELSEFDRQHDSLHERVHTDRMKRRARQTNKKEVGTSSSSISFAAPTLRVGDQRTPEEMVTEAARAMDRGMSEIGGGAAAVAPPVQMEANLLQVLAARKREEWASSDGRKKLKGGFATETKNAFAALDELDSDEDEDDADPGGWGGTARSETMAPSAKPVFSFSPASFSFSCPPIQTAVVVGTAAVDDDPDL